MVNDGGTNKKYRFFYHYFRGKKAMSIHFKGTCYVVKNVVCHSPCETKWNKRQPYLVMQGFTNNVVIVDDVAYVGFK